MSIFGSDYKGRKNQPIFHFLVRYFPKALAEITKVCVAGNVQHNPELDPTDINWSRDKSIDQLNTAMRHMMDHATIGPRDKEPEAVQEIIGGNTYHLAKAAWRIMAELELQIEKDQAAKPVTFTAITETGQSELTCVGPPASRKPNCPICGFNEFAELAPAYAYGTGSVTEKWMCEAGHPVYYFGDSL